MKYVETEIVFREIPDEITLAINISECPNKCPDCHSKHLWNDIGKPLNWHSLRDLIRKNKGISCVCFMGGDADTENINMLAESIRNSPVYEYLKIGWYSGLEHLPSNIKLENFDYIKLGRYDSSKGALDSPTTNQRFYEVCRISKIPLRYCLINKTNSFWK